jgi:hypothetical protein
VLWLGLRTTPTVVEWTVVVGAPTVGVAEAGAVVVGAMAVGVARGATVPGWAPLAGVVVAGVLEAGVVDAGVVDAGAGVVNAVVPCTRADAGIGIPKARSVLLVAPAPKAAAGPAARQPATTAESTHARAGVRPYRRVTIIPVHANESVLAPRGSACITKGRNSARSAPIPNPKRILLRAPRSD